MLTQSSLEVPFPPSSGYYNIDEATLHKKHRPVLLSACSHALIKFGGAKQRTSCTVKCRKKPLIQVWLMKSGARGRDKAHRNHQSRIRAHKQRPVVSCVSAAAWNLHSLMCLLSGQRGPPPSGVPIAVAAAATADFWGGAAAAAGDHWSTTEQILLDVVTSDLIHWQSAVQLPTTNYADETLLLLFLYGWLVKFFTIF